MEQIIKHHDIFNYLCEFLPAEDIVSLRQAYLPNHPVTKQMARALNKYNPKKWNIYFSCTTCGTFMNINYSDVTRYQCVFCDIFVCDRCCNNDGLSAFCLDCYEKYD